MDGHVLGSLNIPASLLIDEDAIEQFQPYKGHLTRIADIGRNALPFYVLIGVTSRCEDLKVISIPMEKVMLCEQLRPLCCANDDPVDNIGTYPSVISSVSCE